MEDTFYIKNYQIIKEGKVKISQAIQESQVYLKHISKLFTILQEIHI